MIKTPFYSSRLLNQLPKNVSDFETLYEIKKKKKKYANILYINIIYYVYKRIYGILSKIYLHLQYIGI